jgi:hypothetical protein
VKKLVLSALILTLAACSGKKADTNEDRHGNCLRSTHDDFVNVTAEYNKVSDIMSTMYYNGKTSGLYYKGPFYYQGKGKFLVDSLVDEVVKAEQACQRLKARGSFSCKTSVDKKIRYISSGDEEIKNTCDKIAEIASRYDKDTGNSPFIKKSDSNEELNLTKKKSKKSSQP